MAAPLVWPLVAEDRATPVFTRVSGAMDRTAASATRMEKRMATAGSALTKNITLPTVAAAAASVDLAAKYQKSMLLVQTQAGASAKQVAKFSAALLKLSPKVATGPEDLSVSLYHVDSALKKVGASAPQMVKTVKIAAEGAKVGMTDVEDTTNSLTAALSSGIVRFNQAGKAMGALNAIVGAGDMHFSDLNEALGTGLLVTMKTFGVSLKDTGAALAVFGDNNIRGADAATKLRMSVQDLAKPAATAAPYFKQINLTVGQLRDSLEKNGLNGALDLLSQKMTAAGVTGNKVGAFLEDAFTKRAGAGLAILLTRLQQFHEAQGAVQKGASGFGAAWQATTKTASFQFDQLGAKLEVLGIKIGDALLPVFLKITNGISSVVSWFEKLDGTQAKVAAWSVGVLAALGPVLKIVPLLSAAGSMFTRFASTVVAGMASLALRSRVDSGLVATSVGRVTAAVSGVAIGAAVGSFTSHASTLTKTLGVLGSAAAGAAIGFGSGGGPVGAIIGGLAGGVSALATSFSDMGTGADAASKAAQAGLLLQRSAAQGLLSTLQQVNGAYGKQTRAWTAQALSQSGALDIAATQNINLGKLTRLTMQGKAAAYVSRLANLGKIDDSAAVVGDGKAADDAKSLVGILSRIEMGAAGAEGQWEHFKSAVQGTVVPSKLLSGGLSNLGKELKGTGTDLQYQIKRWDEVNGKWGFYNQTVNQNSADAKRNTAVVQANLASIGKQAAQMLKQGKSLPAATRYWNDNTDALKKNLENLGFAKPAVDKLFATLAKPPKPIALAITADKAQAEAQKLQERINKIQQGKVPSLTANPAEMLRVLAGLQFKLDGLRQTKTPRLYVDPSGAVRGVSVAQGYIDNLHGKTVDVYVNTHNVALSGTSSRAPGVPHARGGSVADGWFTTGEEGRGWELGFKQGSQVRLWSHKKSMAMTGMPDKLPGYASGTNPYERVSTAVGKVGSLPSPKFTLGKVGDYAIVMREIAHAWVVLNKQIDDGLKKSTADHFKGMLALYAREAKGQLVALERSILQSRVTKQLTQIDNKLNAAQSRLATVQGNYNQTRSSVSSAVGGFDVTTAGVGTSAYTDQAPPPISSGSILSQLTKAAGQARKFGALLRKLSKEGLAKPLILQLAQAGPTAMAQAQALASATPKVLSQIDSQYKALGSYGSAAGKFAANLQYGTQLDSAQDLVSGLQRQKKKLSQEFKEIGRDMADEIIREFNHRNDKHGGRGNHIEVHVHGVSSPEAAALAAVRRLRMHANV